MNSLAVCERAELPGPILNEGQESMAWSDNVGEPKGFSPISSAFFIIFSTSGELWLCPNNDDEFSTKERALSVHHSGIFFSNRLKISLLL